MAATPAWDDHKTMERVAAMDGAINEFGQRIGRSLPDWQARPAPARVVLEGHTARLEPTDPDRHATSLFAAYDEDRDGRGWTYMPYGPFPTLESLRDWMAAGCAKDDPLFFTIIDRNSERALGIFALQRIDRANGVIEIAHVRFSPALQGTRIATEAMILAMRYVFDELGYRRCEWKCDALNAASRAAAQRLGFRFEGVFRQAIIYRGRNRDTAWFSVIDGEWPNLRKKLDYWLRPANFDDDGRQRERLSVLTAMDGGKDGG